MIGDGYFQLRAQIGTSLFSLNKLARDFDGTEESLAALQALQARLREPFLFLTLGPAGAGKSMLLNALFGREFAGGTPFTGRAVVFRYGAETRDQPVAEDFVEAQRPYVFLRDFTVVDTPGLQAPAASPELLTRFLPSADLVLFVFPVKGDAASAWEFLTSLERDQLRRFIFLVQGCDLVTPDEVLLSVKRLRHTMLARLNQACPIFTVSALTRAGLEKVERYIESEIIASDARCQKLREVCEAGSALLHELAAGPRLALQAAERNAERGEHLRLTAMDRKDQSLRHVGGALWPITKIFDAAQGRGEELLRKKLGLLGLRKDSPEWWRRFHHEVEERSREGVRRHLELSLEHLEADLIGARDGRAEASAHPAAANGSREPLDRSALLARLGQVLADCDPDHVTTRAVTAAARGFSGTLRWPKIAAALSLAALLAAWLTSQFFPAAVAVAVLTIGSALVFALLKRREVLATLQLQMNRRREAVLVGIEEVVRAAIQRFYQELTSTLDGLEAAAIRDRENCQPALTRVHQLKEAFDKCLADVAARKPATSSPSVVSRQTALQV
ncbi:MAG TPA: GTPase [Chthoniobacteraceae bacterium]|jgi:GTPase SAR1 family protein